MPALKDRLHELFRDHPKKRPVDLATALGTSRATVSAWMNGTNKSISGQHLFGAAKFFGCASEWLQTGKGKKYPEQRTTQGYYVKHDVMFIPLISWQQANHWRDIMNGPHISAFEWLPCPSIGHGPNTFALRIDNDSMVNPYPGQRSYAVGMVIFIDPGRELTPGCRVVASISGDAVFREYRKEGGKTYLKAYNPQYPDRDLTDDDRIIGVVVGQYLAE